MQYTANIALQAKDSLNSNLSKLCNCDSNLMQLVTEIQTSAEKEFVNIQKIIEQLLNELQEKDKQMACQTKLTNLLIDKLQAAFETTILLERKTGLYVRFEVKG